MTRHWQPTPAPHIPPFFLSLFLAFSLFFLSFSFTFPIYFPPHGQGQGERCVRTFIHVWPSSSSSFLFFSVFSLLSLFFLADYGHGWTVVVVFHGI